MMNEALQTIMTPNPFTIEAHETVADSEVKFTRYNVSYLPVMKDNSLIGMISTYDLARKIRSNDNTKELLVKDVMVAKIPKISPFDKVGTAAELFLDRRIHAIAVVDNGSLVGIVTPYDVLKYEFNKEYTRPILYKDELRSHLRAAI
jgi:CBS domain-containing protein